MIDIIPAIDLMGRRCVRLSQGDFDQRIVYPDDPLEVAKQFAAAGLKRVHIVDLDGAKNGKLANIPVLESIAKNTDLTIDYGGGIKSLNDLEAVFSAGAAIANIGSTAVTAPDEFFEWVALYGTERILLGADVRDGKLAINGWQTATSVETLPFLVDYRAKGVRRVFVTDVGVDGMLGGPALEIYRTIRQALPDLELIASGGVRDIEDVRRLEAIGCSGVIVGKAIYEGKITLKDLASQNNAH